MKYMKYRLSFPYGIHLGNGNLDESLSSFSSDTLFSALYIEALRLGDDTADWLLQSAKDGSLLLSDAFPYIGKADYLPKPFLTITKEDSTGDSVQKKAFKKLTYIPAHEMDTYLKGLLDPIANVDALKRLGKGNVKTVAAVSGLDQPLPYHVGTYQFTPGNGLYLIAGSVEENRFRKLLSGLSYAGIGGKRTSGLGRFTIEEISELPAAVFERSEGLCMTLSNCLPREEEMEAALKEACYQVRKRGGFIQSPIYAGEQRKKRDLYMLSAGSCFQYRFQGDVYDVSLGGAHPVYRYGKPLFYAL